MSNFMRAFVTVLLAIGALAQVPICNVAAAEGEAHSCGRHCCGRKR